MKALYSLRDVRKKRGHGFSLSIDRLDFFPGRSYALLGPNGAGKSTLLELLAFLSPPDGGTLSFAGEPVSWNNGGPRQLRGEVTLLHQSPFLFDGTVARNVGFGLAVRGIRGVERRDRVCKALERVGLADFGKRQARELSGGETQRVALARALALEPRILLLDEPASSVDPDHLASLESLLVQLVREGTTVIFSTHLHDQPRRLGSEIVHLERGKLVEAKRPAALRMVPQGRGLPALLKGN